jgi:hypothetical protein
MHTLDNGAQLIIFQADFRIEMPGKEVHGALLQGEWSMLQKSLRKLSDYSSSYGAHKFRVLPAPILCLSMF